MQHTSLPSILGDEFVVGVQCVLRAWAAAEAAPVQAELWQPLHDGAPPALHWPDPPTVHSALPAPHVLSLGGQLGLELVLGGLWRREQDEERAVRQ